MTKEKTKIINKPLINKFYVGQRVITNGKVAQIMAIHQHRLKNTNIVVYDTIREDKSPDRVIQDSVFASMADYSKAVEKFERGELAKLLKKYGK